LIDKDAAAGARIGHGTLSNSRSLSATEWRKAPAKSIASALVRVGMSYKDAVRLSALTKDTKQIRRFLRLARTLHNLEHAER